MGHVFLIHFIIAHLRRHHFPMDRAMFEGSVDLNATRRERPSWIARLEAEDMLSPALVPEAMVGQRVFHYCIGFVAVAIGLFLLVGAIANAPYIHL